MSGIGEMFKKVPLPIWIGLGLVLILILLMNRGGSKQQSSAPVTAPAGPVTTSTVGTQGSQGGAGTDQELGNLSVMTQSGFAQIAQQNQQTLAAIQGNMSNVGTPMQQVGGAIQQTQNGSAQSNATNGTVGQNAGSNPSTVPTA